MLQADHVLIDLTAAAGVIFGALSFIVNIATLRKFVGARRWLHFLSAITSLYIACWYVGDLMDLLEPGPKMALGIRPGILMLISLVAAYSIADTKFKK